jgi:hypothetical protein
MKAQEAAEIKRNADIERENRMIEKSKQIDTVKINKVFIEVKHLSQKGYSRLELINYFVLTEAEKEYLKEMGYTFDNRGNNRYMEW